MLGLFGIFLTLPVVGGIWFWNFSLGRELTLKIFFHEMDRPKNQAKTKWNWIFHYRFEGNLTFSFESYLFQIPLWQSIFCVVKNWKRWEQQQGLFKIQFFSQNALEKLLNPFFRMKTSDLGNFLKKFVQVHSKRFSGQ